MLVLAAVVALLAMPAARLALLTRPDVRAWLACRPDAGRQAVRPGLVVALLAPVAALAASATVLLALASDTPVVYSSSGREYSGSGEPVPPPAPGSGDHDVQWADQAVDCYGGDMATCDDLYRQTPLDDPCETYGSTCGGRRLDEETYGGCVDVFSPTD